MLTLSRVSSFCPVRTSTTIMALFKLHYPITRPFTFRYFTQIVLVLTGLWLVLITLTNIVAVAYETVPFTSTSYNVSTEFWYEKLVPKFLLPQSRSCDGSVIPVSGGCISVTAQTHRFKIFLRPSHSSNTYYADIGTRGLTVR
jgi:hypothetical protein